jgi:hypothetical protein
MGYANQQAFEPVAKVGDNLWLLPGDHPKSGYYRVLFVEPIFEIQHDFGTLAAGGSVEDVEIEDLYMADNELAQYRLQLLDDFKVKVKQPLAKTRFGTDKLITEITAFSQQLAQPELHRNEIFVIEDEKVLFTATNPTKYTSVKNRMRAFGYRYVLEKLPAPVTPFTAVNVGGR